jgi:nucleotide-binding universal stress UspA family protein
VSTSQTIAVGFDGSNPSASAVSWAFQYAARTGADVVLVHAVGLLEHREHPNPSVEFAGEVHALAMESEFDESRVRWYVDNGDACSVLLRCVHAPISATLVVVGSRGQSAHAGHLLGSTSLQLAERSTIPVVIIPATSTTP